MRNPHPVTLDADRGPNHNQATAADPNDKASIDLVELPRLRLNFRAEPDEHGRMRLVSVEHAGLSVSTRCDGRLVLIDVGMSDWMDSSPAAALESMMQATSPERLYVCRLVVILIRFLAAS